jgi:hypothetical protein
MLNDPVISALLDRLRSVMDELRAVGPEMGVDPGRPVHAGTSPQTPPTAPDRRPAPAPRREPVAAA